VTPGLGGSIWLSWAGEWEGDSRIEIWDPPRRPRSVSQLPPFDAEGKPLQGAERTSTALQALFP
jgi:hypothetical protein